MTMGPDENDMDPDQNNMDPQHPMTGGPVGSSWRKKIGGRTRTNELKWILFWNF